MNLIQRYLMLYVYVCVYMEYIGYPNCMHGSAYFYLCKADVNICISFFLIVLYKDLVCIQQHFRLTNSHLQLEKINI